MKYAVLYYIEGKWLVSVENANEIFSRMDMDDCYDISIIDIRLLDEERFCEPCKFFGSWHNPDDPLRMEIRSLKTGKVVEAGYGTDH